MKVHTISSCKDGTVKWCWVCSSVGNVVNCWKSIETKGNQLKKRKRSERGWLVEVLQLLRFHLKAAQQVEKNLKRQVKGTIKLLAPAVHVNKYHSWNGFGKTSVKISIPQYEIQKWKLPFLDELEQFRVEKADFYRGWRNQAKSWAGVRHLPFITIVITTFTEIEERKIHY